MRVSNRIINSIERFFYFLLIFRANVTLTWCYNIQCYNIVLVLIAGYALFDGSTIKWQYHKALESLTENEIQKLSLEEINSMEAECMEKNAWQVCHDVASRSNQWRTCAMWRYGCPCYSENRYYASQTTSHLFYIC